MKTFLRRLDLAARLRRKRVLVPSLVVAAAIALGAMYYSSHTGANAVLERGIDPDQRGP